MVEVVAIKIVNVLRRDVVPHKQVETMPLKYARRWCAANVIGILLAHHSAVVANAVRMRVIAREEQQPHVRERVAAKNHDVCRLLVGFACSEIRVPESTRPAIVVQQHVRHAGVVADVVVPGGECSGEMFRKRARFGIHLTTVTRAVSAVKASRTRFPGEAGIALRDQSGWYRERMITLRFSYIAKHLGRDTGLEWRQRIRS